MKTCHVTNGCQGALYIVNVMTAFKYDMAAKVLISGECNDSVQIWHGSQGALYLVNATTALKYDMAAKVLISGECNDSAQI